ncbi:hypothetical protein HID58_057853, partial [Brassica napus]
AQLTTWARILLGFIVEIALIGADIQEVSGSAIALQILTCAFLPIGLVDKQPLDFISREVLNEETRRFLRFDRNMPLSFSWMFNEPTRSGQELFIVQLRGKTNPKDINRVQEALNYNNVKSSAALFPLFHDHSVLKAWDWEHYLQNKYGGESIPELYIWGIGLWLLDKGSTITGTYAGTVYNGRFTSPETDRISGQL